MAEKIPEDTLDSFIMSVELVYRELIVLDATDQLNSEQQVETDIIRSSLSTFRSLRDLRHMEEYYSISQVQSLRTRFIGRPRFQIPREQLSLNRFSVPQITDMLGVSIRTIRRTMDEYVLSTRVVYLSMNWTN